MRVRIAPVFFMRILLSILCLVFSFAVLADIGEIKRSGMLRVALISHDVFPFVYEKDGILDGIDVRLAKQLGQELGVEVEFIRASHSFNGVVDSISDFQADIAISKISITLSRIEKVAFTRPYLVLNQGLLFDRVAMARLKGDQSERQMIRQLRGNVAVMSGSSYEEYLKRLFPHANAVVFDDWDSSINALFGGEVDAVYRDDFEVKRVMATRKNASLLAKSVTLVDRKDEIAIVVGWENPRLLAWVDRFLLTRLPQPLNAVQVLENHTQLFKEVVL
jgi:polar amino acid transport system substrate-binding protein